MALTRDRCICLRKVEYSETSQILTLLGRQHGLLRLIAKGAHRRTKAGASKFDGGLDLLDLGEAVFSLRLEKDLATLTEWSLREGHLSLRRSLRSLYLAQYAAEITGLIVQEHDPHPALFDRMENLLQELATPRLEESALAFQLDLLKETGYMPELSRCVNCGAPFQDREAWHTSALRGGIVCAGCESLVHDRAGIDPRLLSMLIMMMRLPRQNGAAQRLPRLVRVQTDPLNRFLAAHIQFNLGRKLHLARHVLNPPRRSSA